MPIAIGNIVNLYTSIMEDKGLRPQLAVRRPQLAKKHYPESSPSIMNQISNMKKKGTVRDSKKLHATVPFGASGGT